MRDCINSFIKECCAYAILQGQEFIPKIHQVGTLTSDTNQRATKVFAGENINLKGFYIIMEYIDTISLTKCWISQNECLNIQAKKALKSIHDYGISHGGITHENFLIKNSDKYKDNLKVYFIDFGCCKFSKLQTQFPNICTNKKSFNNSKKRDEANINQYFIDL
ncbi:hypothetical protein DFJ63DRAFT_316854 [Scheffersomyces coipomensis]|uniref:uncharacterized protein n=1 Tax=Scheffersomyces coipomensis TaxID=1788519 RepID=UPI00315DF577